MFDAPTDCILANITVAQPDIAFVAAQHASRISERAIEGAPTLAVEILSPSTEEVDRHRKRELYARHGVAHYWIVDPIERTIEAHTLEHGIYRISARLAGDLPVALSPFDDLVLDPAVIWA